MAPPSNGTTTITAEAITASFPIPVIPKIPGDPVYKSIYKVTKVLSENASSIQPTLEEEDMTF
eukprot:1989468-Ditylum_brightwellii.AAC.1